MIKVPNFTYTPNKFTTPGQPFSGAGSGLNYAATGDFNQDGLVDIVYTQVGWPDASVLSPILFWVGREGGGYNIAQNSILNGPITTGFSHKPFVADFNGDSLVDIYIATNGNESLATGEPDILLLSRNDGTIVRSNTLASNRPTWSHGTSVGDFDGDGDIDVFLAGTGGRRNDVARSSLLINNGSGTFVETADIFPGQLGQVVGPDVWASAIADFNNDGFGDLVTGHDGGHAPFINSEGFIRYAPTGTLAKVYINDGKGGFLNPVDLSTGVFGQINTDTVDIDSIDVDNDGFLDLIFSNYNAGWVSDGNGDIRRLDDANLIGNSGLQNAFQWRDIQVFINDGRGSFSDQSERIASAGNGIGVARYLQNIHSVDLNRDGIVDIFGQLTVNAAVANAGIFAWLNDGTGHYQPLDLAAMFIQMGLNNNFQLYNITPFDADSDGDIDLGFPRWVSLDNIGTQGIGFDVIENSTTPNPNFMIGTPVTETLRGDIFANSFYALGGNDVLFGGAGLDTSIYQGVRSAYTITSTSSGRTITDTAPRCDGADTLSGIERLQFSDGILAFDNLHTDNAGRGYLIYRAAFDRVPDAEGLGYWIRELDRGQDYGSVVAASFIASPEFINLNGANTSNEQFVNLLYQNVLHRAGEADGVAYWLSELNSGGARSNMLASFAISPENVINVAPFISDGIFFV